MYECNKSVGTGSRSKYSKKRALAGESKDNEQLEVKRKKELQVPIDLQIKFANVSQIRKALSQPEFEDELVKMLVRDMQPLATVERPGYVQFCSNCLPSYSLISRRTAG